MEELSSQQLKRFLKHLCRVAKRYHERESAKRELDLHIRRIKKSEDVENEISALNKKINLLLEKESKVTELGLKKNPGSKIQKRIALLEEQLAMTQEERDKLTEENESLKSAIESISSLKSAYDLATETSVKAQNRVEKIENKVEKKYRDAIIRGLKEKISLLEGTYQEISKDKSISPNRLFNIERRIRDYKEKLKGLRSS